MPGCGSKGNSDVENEREGPLAIGGEGVSVVIGRGINSDSGWGGPVAPPNVLVQLFEISYYSHTLSVAFRDWECFAGPLALFCPTRYDLSCLQACI